MKKIEEKKFNIKELLGISKTNIEEHMKLYSGYVNHANLILEKIEDLSEDVERNAFVINEMQRRFGFEFNGIVNHEIYFSVLEGGALAIDENGALYKEIRSQWGSYEKWLQLFKQVAKTRGIGWAILYYDPNSKQLLNGWVDEQHMGQLNSAIPILAIDMWEHSFVADYQPSGKGKYIDDFFANLNWSVIEKKYDKAIK